MDVDRPLALKESGSTTVAADRFVLTVNVRW
jgi:hypothetical protein